MKDIWRGSDPDSFDDDYAEFYGKRGTPLVGWWWGFHLVMCLVLNVSIRLMGSTLPQNLTLDLFVVATWINIVGHAVAIIAAALAIQLVLRVTANQEERFRLAG
jgi:hypothetical protein